MAVIDELRLQLYNGDNPFLSAQLKYIDPGYTHTNIAAELIDTTLQIIRPTFWLEIGTMLGGSAIRTADAIKKAAMPTQVVAAPAAGTAALLLAAGDLPRCRARG